MEENNTKKIVTVLIIIFLIILFIVLLSIKDVFFKFDSEKKDTYTTTTTINSVDTSYKELSTEDIKKYNKIFLEKDFLLPINIIVKINRDLYGTNLIQSERNKFIYVISVLGKNDATLAEINEKSQGIFNNDISERNIEQFRINDLYHYDYNEEYLYCFKATKIKNDNNKTYIKVDIISYNENDCRFDNLDYQKDQEGLITYQNNNNKKYLSGFTLIEKEGR